MELVTGDAFDALFAGFEHTAFRLETRESYAGIAYEVEPFRRFLTGQEFDTGFLAGWLDLVRAAVAAGKRFARVRVVSEPWSDYTRFGVHVCRHTVEAGEDIRYLPRRLAAGLPELDFWLFDSRRLFVLHFDERDDLRGAEEVDDPAQVVAANGWRDRAWHHAVPAGRYGQNEVRVQR